MKNIFELFPVVDHLIDGLPVDPLGEMTYTQSDFNDAVYACEQLARIYSAMRDSRFDSFVKDIVQPSDPTVTEID